MKMIRTASKAIIIQNGCLLAIKMHDSGEDFYVLPGGGQENGENLHANLQRECLEEIGVPVEIGSLLFVRDYIGSNHGYEPHAGQHQVEFFFACCIQDGGSPASGSIPDKNQVGIEWLPLKELADCPLFPAPIRELIIRHANGETGLPVYMGDVN
ncbi:NUDIX domain-containing protein [Bacillus infantis]|nr:NUDIX domain-containing protein [Bacillus infantis]